MRAETIERWTCDSVGYYRNKPASVARFSEDGSVLAVAFDSTLTVWETDTNVPRERLAIPSCDEHIKSVGVFCFLCLFCCSLVE